MNAIPKSNVTEKIFRIVFFLTFLSSYHYLPAQRLSRDYEMGLLTNQAGYLPASVKTCLMRGAEKKDFEAGL